MPTFLWKSFSRVDPERQYVVMLSDLPLKRRWRIFWFLLQTWQIMRQLKKRRGVIGYSLYAQFRKKHFWTLSLWEDEITLQHFVDSKSYARIPSVLAQHIDQARFRRWTIKGANLPERWPMRLDAGEQIQIIKV
jgi:hypothetical protein